MNDVATLYAAEKRREIDGIEAIAALLVERIEAALDDEMLAGPKRQKLGEIRGHAEDVLQKIAGVLGETNGKAPIVATGAAVRSGERGGPVGATPLAPVSVGLS